MKRRWLAAVAIGMVGAGCGAGAQMTGTVSAGGAQKLEFTVASVRQNKSQGGSSYSNFSLDSGNIYTTVNRDDAFAPTGGYFSAKNFALWRYIVFAYNLSGTQEMALRFGFFTGLATNAPKWAVGGFDGAPDRFDIEARAEGNPTKDQMRLMMQALLSERFKLAVHTETREVPVLALVLVKPGRLGPKLQQHPADDTCADEAPLEKQAAAAGAAYRESAVGELPIVCGVTAKVASLNAGLHYGGRNVPLAQLASSLPTMTGLATLPKPVVDRTGLSGRFDFTLGGWVSDAAAEAGEPGPTFAGALKDQLGLKVEPAKGMVEVLVIDHVERPSEN